MNLTKPIKGLILIGILFSVYVCYALVMMNDHALPWWNFTYGILFSICIICSWGLMNQKSWAYWLSLVLASAGLGLGLYFVHFAWTFWIFKQPTFLERVFAVLNLRIFIFTLVPAVWLRYFLRPTTRTYFQS